MSRSDLASLGSFVSGFAVLVSLVFLYFQLRQMNSMTLNSRGGVPGFRSCIVRQLRARGKMSAFAPKRTWHVRRIGEAVWRRLLLERRRHC